MKINISAFDVADYFLKIVDRDSGSSITNLKLQKILYYAQGWHLAFTGIKLFENKIEAWVHGPVCPEVYKKYSKYGCDSIPDEPEKISDNFTLEQIEILDKVWGTYGDYDGKYLEELTHEEKPWKEARGSLADNESCSAEVSTDTMKNYFKELLSSK